MKKKVLWHAGLVCSCVVLLIMVSSCDMFTTSLAKPRDQSKVLEKASASQLAEMAAGTGSANPDTARAIMAALGKNPEALKDLNKEEKEAILNLALDTTLPMSTLTEVADDLLGENDSSGDMTEADAKELVETIFDSVEPFDTTALTAILKDPNTLEAVDPSTLANAAIAAIAQVAKNVGVDNIMGTGGDDMTAPDVDFEKDTPAQIVEKLLKNAKAGGGTVLPEDEEALTAAVTVAKLLTTGKVTSVDGTEIERTDYKDAKLLGIVDLSEILGAFGG